MNKLLGWLILLHWLVIEPTILYCSTSIIGWCNHLNLALLVAPLRTKNP